MLYGNREVSDFLKYERAEWMSCVSCAGVGLAQQSVDAQKSNETAGIVDLIQYVDALLQGP
jgi:hypothetical protein